MTEIKLVRIYDHEQPEGYRILVDRMWPRGMSKVKADLGEWDKQIGPTNELRKWFNHEDENFPNLKKSTSRNWMKMTLRLNLLRQ